MVAKDGQTLMVASGRFSVQELCHSSCVLVVPHTCWRTNEEEITAGDNEGLCSLNFSRNTVTVVKWEKMRWEAHIARPGQYFRAVVIGERPTLCII